MMSADVWECLGIQPTGDQTLIRKRYAELVRQYRPDHHPAEFAAIRSAYEEALRMANSRPLGPVLAASANPLESPSPKFEHGEECSVPVEPKALPRTYPERIEPYHWNVSTERDAVLNAMAGNDVNWLKTWLESAYGQARNGTFDAMQDFEAFLVHLLLQHAAPTPAFVEQCARLMSWPARWAALAAEFGEGPSLRLRGVLHLAVQYRFFTQSASNPWLHRVFEDGIGRVPWLGWSPLLDDAMTHIQEWKLQCKKWGYEGYLADLNPYVLQHLEGETVHSADIKHALLVMTYGLAIAIRAPAQPFPVWLLTLIALVTFVASCGCRPVWHVLRRRVPLQTPLRWLRRFGILLLVLMLVCGLAEHEIAAIAWLDEPMWIFKLSCLAYFLVFFLWAHWWMVFMGESALRIFKLRKMASADQIWWEKEREENPLDQRALEFEIDYRIYP